MLIYVHPDIGRLFSPQAGDDTYGGFDTMRSVSVRVNPVIRTGRGIVLL